MHCIIMESFICQVTSLCSAPVAQDLYMRALEAAQASAVTGLILPASLL